MRKDLVLGGAATGSLMLIVTWILSFTSLPVPAVMSQMILVVAVVGWGTLFLGIILRSPPTTERRGDGSDGKRL